MSYSPALAALLANPRPVLPARKPEEVKVVVAMSGGVDSSTVAALLHNKGYQVIGVTLQLYDLAVTLEKKGACCAGQDIYDAKQVADRMGFPHYVLNYESLFKQSVMEDFADSYLRGETPIPCVKCNQTVKFRDLLKVAKELGADAMATGHYIQRHDGPQKTELHRAANLIKDQSYFLFATTQEQLDYLYFPLGGLQKEDTRQLAAQFGLEVADKPDSQDICFVPNGSYSKVIERLRPHALDPGEIVHLDGTILGTHQGIINYTIGQRRGLGIASADPLYVIRLDPEKRHVIVGPKAALGRSSLKVKELNWLDDMPLPNEGREVLVKLRSAHTGVLATVLPLETTGQAEVQLHEPQEAVTPGQACVMYEGSRVLGGGWIVA